MSSKKTIGAGIAIDGEKEFKTQIKEINGVLGVLKSEMKLTASAFDNNGKSMNDMRAKSEVLSKQIDNHKDKISTLENALNNAKKAYEENTALLPKMESKLASARAEYETTAIAFGKNSDEAKKAKTALNEAEKAYSEVAKATDSARTRVNEWQKSLNETKADLNKMNKELDELKSQTSGIKKIKNTFSEVKDKIEEVEQKTSGLKKAFSAVGTGAKKVGSLTVAGIGASVTAIAGLTTATVGAVTKFLSLADAGKEVNTAMSKLHTAFEAVNMSESNANRTLKELYGVLGDTDKSVEASMLIAKMSNSQIDLAKNTRILTGVYALYGDSIPTEGLAEGMQATAKMGAVQGVLADALEWQGVNLDNFNKKLSTLSTEEARAAYIQDTLTQLYGKSADAYRETNAVLIESNEAQLRYEQNLAAIGNAAIPAMTSLKNFGASLLADVLPGVEKFGSGLHGLFEGDKGASVEIADGLNDIINPLLDNINKITPIVTDVITEVAPTLIQSLATGLINNLEPLFNSVMDIFDYLINTISDNKEQLLTAATTIITKLATDLLDMLPDIISVGLDLIIGLVDGLTKPESLEQLFNAACECIKKIVSTIIEKIPDILKVGGQIIEGLWNGIKDKGAWLMEKISGFFGGVKQSIKDFFGIASPSKWARYEIMGNVMNSFGLAIDENADNVRKKMTAFTSSLQNDVKMQYSIETLTDRITAAQPSQKIIAATYSQYEDPSMSQTSQSDKFDRILALLEIIAMNSNKQIVLDKDTVVGELAPEINKNLGSVVILKDRGD